MSQHFANVYCNILNILVFAVLAYLAYAMGILGQVWPAVQNLVNSL